jgi:hypothetical protein
VQWKLISPASGTSIVARSTFLQATTHIALAQFLSETICQSLEPTTGNDRHHAPGASQLCSDSEGTIAMLLSASFACWFDAHPHRSR